MTKLYEHNSFLTHFTGQVLSCEAGKKGFDVILDQTAFYPEGGGQPYDTGTLGGVTVLEVHTRGGSVVHTCDGPLEPGRLVEGEINWARRFDLMQQHSGEHIVSGLAHSRYGCDNVGFHMGSEVITIDLNVDLDETQVAALEKEANTYIWENHPVQVLYPTREELDALNYRSKKPIDGQVRIVTFPGADTCACCGTHVAFSGQVGLVKLLSVQKFRDGVRIELVCGGRALRYLDRAMAQNHRVSNLLSAKIFETGAAVERVLAENERLKSRILELEDRHFDALVQSHAGEETVVLFEDGLSPDGLRRLCDRLINGRSGLCACFSGSDGEGYKYAIGRQEGDLRSFIKELNRNLVGRGGGTPCFAQGAVTSEKSRILDFFAREL